MNQPSFKSQAELKAYISTATNFVKVKTKQRTLWCCRPKVGTFVQNLQTGEKVGTTAEIQFLLQGAWGEYYVIDAISLSRTYTFADGAEITPNALKAKLKNGVIDWFQVKQRSGIEHYALFIPAKFSTQVKTSVGEQIINSELVAHGKGDFVICSRIQGLNILNRRVLNGLAFGDTYNNTGWGDCVDTSAHLVVKQPKSILKEQSQAEEKIEGDPWVVINQCISLLLNIPIDDWLTKKNAELAEYLTQNFDQYCVFAQFPKEVRQRMKTILGYSCADLQKDKVAPDAFIMQWSMLWNSFDKEQTAVKSERDKVVYIPIKANLTDNREWDGGEAKVNVVIPLPLNGRQFLFGCNIRLKMGVYSTKQETPVGVRIVFGDWTILDSEGRSLPGTTKVDEEFIIDFTPSRNGDIASRLEKDAEYHEQKGKELASLVKSVFAMNANVSSSLMSNKEVTETTAKFLNISDRVTTYAAKGMPIVGEMRCASEGMFSCMRKANLPSRDIPAYCALLKEDYKAWCEGVRQHSAIKALLNVSMKEALLTAIEHALPVEQGGICHGVIETLEDGTKFIADYDSLRYAMDNDGDVLGIHRNFTITMKPVKIQGKVVMTKDTLQLEFDIITWYDTRNIPREVIVGQTFYDLSKSIDSAKNPRGRALSPEVHTVAKTIAPVLEKIIDTHLTFKSDCGVRELYKTTFELTTPFCCDYVTKGISLCATSLSADSWYELLASRESEISAVVPTEKMLDIQKYLKYLRRRQLDLEAGINAPWQTYCTAVAEIWKYLMLALQERLGAGGVPAYLFDARWNEETSTPEGKMYFSTLYRREEAATLVMEVDWFPLLETWIKEYSEDVKDSLFTIKRIQIRVDSCIETIAPERGYGIELPGLSLIRAFISSNKSRRESVFDEFIQTLTQDILEAWEKAKQRAEVQKSEFNF